MPIRNPDVIIMSGGKGTRFGAEIEPYACKSLIPLAGKPALEYVLRETRKATSGRIFLCFERSSLQERLSNFTQRIELENFELVLNEGLYGTMECIFRLGNKVKTSHLFLLYGHHPVPAQHLLAMLEQDEKALVTTLFATSSNDPREIAIVDESGVVQKLITGDAHSELRSGEYYVDPPYRWLTQFAQDKQYRNARSRAAVQS